MNCDFWAKSCQFISADSIHTHLSNSPLNKLVALTHFFTQQKRNILSVPKKDDSTIQLLYEISKEKFESECTIEEEKLLIINNLCFKAKTQFEKIIDSLKNEESTERAIKLAEDGQHFFYHQLKKYEKDKEAIPTAKSRTNDATFIEEFMNNKVGRMNWERCFNEGRNNNFFGDYSNWKTLKSAYHNNNKKLRKRKITEIEQ